jgi:chromosome segregation ATPase
MDQELLKSSLNGLERKIQMLLSERQSMRTEIESLKVENQDLRSAVKNREEQISGFQNQLKLAKLVDRIHPDDGSASEMKKRVDEYIREIDKCIAHLSR